MLVLIPIGHFTVMYGTEAGVDLVLIQTFLLYHVNQVILMLTSIFHVHISITKQRRFVSNQGHRQPHIHSKAKVLSPQLKNGLLPEEPLGPLYMSVTSLLRSPTRNWVFRTRPSALSTG